MENTRNKTRKILNMRCLKKLFPGVKDILLTCTSSTLYMYDTPGKIWFKCEISGPMFFCPFGDSKEAYIIILNQINEKDWYTPVSSIQATELNDKQKTLYIKLKNRRVQRNLDHGDGRFAADEGTYTDIYQGGLQEDQLRHRFGMKGLGRLVRGLCREGRENSY
jgi:hypothetical protein